MAIAMVLGAVLNVAAFTGGNVLAKNFQATTGKPQKQRPKDMIEARKYSAKPEKPI